MSVLAKRHNSIRRLCVTGIMSAFSFVLMVLEFSLPFVPSFLKFDFSDLPALLTSFALGPIWGVLTELIKNLLHLSLSQTSGVGELANFMVGSALVFTAGIVYRYHKTRSGALVGTLCGMVISAVLSFPVNLYLTYPFYEQFMPMETILSMYHAIFPFVETLPQALLFINVPFTLFKGLVIAVITFVIYKKLSPLLKGKKEDRAV